jgi:hypothetical protein
MQLPYWMVPGIQPCCRQAASSHVSGLIGGAATHPISSAVNNIAIIRLVMVQPKLPTVIRLSLSLITALPARECGGECEYLQRLSHNGTHLEVRAARLLPRRSESELSPSLKPDPRTSAFQVPNTGLDRALRPMTIVRRGRDHPATSDPSTGRRRRRFSR